MNVSDRGIVNRSNTTDTSLQKRANDGTIGNMKFDQSVYSADPTSALQKDLFYISPYLTCEECNGIVYIDASKLRSRLNLNQFERVPPPPKEPGMESDEEEEEDPHKQMVIPSEPLPPCPGCHRTNTFRIGATDLTMLLASNVEELARKKRVQKRMAIKLQRCYRYYLARRYGRAQRHALIIKRMLDFRCASAIQAMARGRLGRRRKYVEEALVVIKKAHNLLLNRALYAKNYQMRVFWYKTKTELDILYSDYYVLVERTGHNPPLCIVEDNVKEIARRILDRISELATKVQARWKGISVRRYLNVYRLEVTRVREILAGAAFKIQRTFRGLKGRYLAGTILNTNLKDKILDEYQTERFNKQEARNMKEANDKLKVHYTKERQEERSARFTGLVNPKLADGKKMKAFHESMFGDDSVQILMDDFMSDVKARKEREDQLEEEKKVRAEWVRVEQLKDPGLKLYFEEEMRERREGIIKTLTKERPLRNVADMLMNHNSKKIIFKYPDTCYSDPLSILKEEIVVKTVRRDKQGRRIRNADEKKELADYARKGRRTGMTVQQILDTAAPGGEKGGGEVFVKANAAANAAALVIEQPGHGLGKGRRGAAPAVVGNSAQILAHDL